MKDKNVLIIGTGTIGLPLIGLLVRHKDRFGIDNVLFNKNTPLKHDSAQIKQMIGLGAKLVTDKDKFAGFANLGLKPEYTKEEAISQATVVIDCTPKGIGLQNKREYYDKYKDRVKRFIFQGSENGSGVKFAAHIVELDRSEQFIQVVSCNSHSIAALLKSFQNNLSSASPGGIVSGDFCCLRRSNDISQNNGFVPSISANRHDDEKFGTHHCADVFDLIKSQFPHIKLYSSAVKLNTQYMHAIRFSMELDSVNSSNINNVDDVLDCFKNNPMVALTNKMTSNQIFSMGRDFGLYGRILSQAVVCEPTVSIRKVNLHSVITGISYTSQDGNSLLSSVYAAIQAMHPDTVEDKIKCLDTYIFNEI